MSCENVGQANPDIAGLGVSDFVQPKLKSKNNKLIRKDHHIFCYIRWIIFHLVNLVDGSGNCDWGEQNGQSIEAIHAKCADSLGALESWENKKGGAGGFICASQR